LKYSSLIFPGLLLLLACEKDVSSPIIEEVEEKVFYEVDDFIMGADLSYVNAIEANEAQYFFNNKPKDPYLIFKESGANLVRLRLWHTPSLWQKNLNGGNISSNFSDVKKSIKRAKELNLAVLLDLHYSDEWADPGKQFKPAAWEGFDTQSLKDSVYHYTKGILEELSKESLTPEYIQIGNECNQGMLFPEGKIVNNNFKPFAELLKSGIKAVKDFSLSSAIKPKIILHVAQFQHADWWMNGLMNQENLRNFDILGVSHYFPYSNLISMDALTLEITKLKTKYEKDVMILETAYPWTSENADGYTNIFSGMESFGNYPISKTGQYEYLKDLTAATIAGAGIGIIYWEPAWISSNMKDKWGTGSSWENNALFDFAGNTLPAMDFMTYNYKLKHQ
jgi:arabinogalactan endo-1,4-beta-galactosidase